ncbi:hypothetical protein T459_07125 [Capsicum annuum]|uniref:F-box domain-containing protein n=1 Tax=Capsicum annuum TaxID=4072 RepID=A0A2G3ACM8_CAPAN|nr:hypothetical protein T459_07125 [Capsicum annuum]
MLYSMPRALITSILSVQNSLRHSPAYSSTPPSPQKGTISVVGSGRNRLYALTNRQEAKASPHVVTGTLQIFSRDVYLLLDPGSILSYVTPYVAVGFGFKPDMIAESFSISTPMGDFVMARRVYKNCVVSILSRDTVADLLELDIVNFDAILGMDWLHSCYATLDCRTQKVHEPKVDYASQLPDDVLSSILARIEIKDAVKTSILCRRWRYLFASMPTLRFSHNMIGYNYLDHTCPPYYQQKFWKVVNQFFQLYLGRKVVELEMRIFIERKFSSEFGRLMHSISKFGVERLHLNFSCVRIPASRYIYPKRNRFFEFSLELCVRIPASRYIYPKRNRFFEFSLELLSQASSLKSLFLSVCVVQPSVTLRLNSLETLFLTRVLLESGQLEGILSSCLNLNQLIIKYCKLPHKLCISGTVKFVSFVYSDGLKEIDLKATNLRGFECFFNYKVRFYFSSVPVLEYVKISLRGDASMPYIFGEFATDLPAQVKSLIVTTCYAQATHFPTEMQIFGNLRMLALLFESTYDFDIVKVCPVLEACPVLQYLDILILDQLSKLCPINRATDLGVLKDKFETPSPINRTNRDLISLVHEPKVDYASQLPDDVLSSILARDDGAAASGSYLQEEVFSLQGLDTMIEMNLQHATPLLPYKIKSLLLIRRKLSQSG